ncbi:CoA-transferase [Amycolatopsis thermoflava]|uniref:CoA-transferase n=1 Tax=Amycolatopsis thermoflava TaxID=84480 RepID=UPI003EBE9B91
MTSQIIDDPGALCRRHLVPGTHIHVASTMSRPNALLLALARVFRGRAVFDVSSNAFHANMHALAIAGVVRHAITCFAGDTYPSPRPNPLYADLPEGKPFTVEEWSLLALLQRLIAGACGNPVTVTTSLAGSDLEARGTRFPAEFADAQDCLTVPALRPDVTFLHAPCADRRGNLYLNGPRGEGWWGAMAARRGVLATVERVVDRPPSGGVSIPADRVLGIARCEFGAHPQGLPPWPECGFAGYRDDYSFLAELADTFARPGGPDAWFDRWVLTPAGHVDYLAGLGSDRLAALRRLDPLRRPVAEGGPSWRERHVVVAARAIADRVRAAGYHTLLAGIGTAHIASWLAAAQLAREGHPLQVHAELGLIDMSPAAGDAFLFAQAHVSRSRAHGDSLDVLGALTAGGYGRALAVLSAGEIDPAGRINSSRTADGRYLVGSGGANDFATHLETLVVAPASPRKLVPRVHFVTCPGKNVLTVATQYGRLVRESAAAPFHLGTWMAPDDDTGADPVSTLRARTSWPVPDSSPEWEKPITDEELSTLRTLDPEGFYR